MNHKFLEAREHVAKAREALRRGDKESARRLGEKAALLMPAMEDAWLVLVASDPNPQDALAHARKAMEINPESARARRGVEWALGRVRQVQVANARVTIERNVQNGAIKNLPKRVYKQAIPHSQLKTSRQNWLYPVILVGAGCIVFGFAALFALTAKYPAVTSIVSSISTPMSTQENLWASVDIAKPTVTPIDVRAFAPQEADSPTSTSVTLVPPLSASPVPTETPGTVAMEIIADEPVSQYGSTAEPQVQYPAEGKSERWIDVNLSEQRVYAYEDDTVVNSFVVSTGVAQTPTVTGNYKIWIKVRVQDMSGPGYYLRDVPYVMFFYKDYGFHGTYWHNNFGTPMSRGCVNLTTLDSEWLYNWASVGTVVNVHY